LIEVYYRSLNLKRGTGADWHQGGNRRRDADRLATNGAWRFAEIGNFALILKSANDFQSRRDGVVAYAAT
jgi:hypothetical protein